MPPKRTIINGFGLLAFFLIFLEISGCAKIISVNPSAISSAEEVFAEYDTPPTFPGNGCRLSLHLNYLIIWKEKKNK